MPRENESAKQPQLAKLSHNFRFEQHSFLFCQAGGVEVWRGGLGGAYRFPTLSAVGASLASPCFRFHTPLIEPDVRIARIRLSEKVSRCRPRKTMGPCGETDQAQLVVENGVRKLLGRLPRDTVLTTQPLAQPLAGVAFHSSVGFADWSQTEVVGPSDHRAVELRYHHLLGPAGVAPVRSFR